MDNLINIKWLGRSNENTVVSINGIPINSPIELSTDGQTVTAIFKSKVVVSREPEEPMLAVNVSDWEIKKVLITNDKTKAVVTYYMVKNSKTGKIHSHIISEQPILYKDLGVAEETMEYLNVEDAAKLLTKVRNSV